MSIQVICQCGASFAARDELAGKQIECVTCGQPLQVPYPQAPVQPASAPVQYHNQTSPIYNAPPKGAPNAAAARWPLIATAVGAAGIAVAGGILFFTTNNRISSLNKTIGEQTKTLETQSKTLTEQLSTINKKVTDQSTTLETKLDDKITTVSKTLTEAKTDKVETEKLVENVKGLSDKLDKETEVQKANKKELDDLVKKTGTLRSEISAIDGNIAKEVATKSAGFEARIKDLEDSRKKIKDEFQAELAKKGGLLEQVNAHEAVIQGLNAQIKTEVTKLLPNMKPITDRLDSLESGVNPEPVYKKVITNRFGNRIFYGLRTLNGAARYRDKNWGFWRTIDIAAPTLLNPTKLVDGRFDIKIRYNQLGDMRDALLLDTHAGTVWRNTPGSGNWIRMGIIGSGPLVNYEQNNAYRLDVDVNKASSSGPGVFLTDTRTDRVFADDFANPAFLLEL